MAMAHQVAILLPVLCALSFSHEFTQDNEAVGLASMDLVTSLGDNVHVASKRETGLVGPLKDATDLSMPDDIAREVKMAKDEELLEEAETDTSPKVDAVAKLESELTQLSTLRTKADNMLKSTGRAVSGLKKAAKKKSAKAGTLSVGADGGNALDAVAKAMDPKVNPCTDFYKYSCGAWLNNTKVPSDAASWSKTFSVINKRNIGLLRKIYSRNDTSTYSTIKKTERKMVQDYYAACMDVEGRNARGLKDGNFTALLKEINDVKDAKELMTLYAKFDLKGYGLGPFSFGVGTDDRSPKKNAAFMSQGGIGLPTRDYYGIAKDNPRFKKVRAAYVKFLTSIFKQAGQADLSATKVLEFETQMAKAMWGKVKMRNPMKTYNPTTIANFTKAHLSFESYFKVISAKYPNFKPDSKLVVNVKPYFEKLEALLGNTDIKILKAYTAKRWINSAMPALTIDAGNLVWEFYGKVLHGAKKRPPLWKRCVGSTKGATWGMGDKMFVEKRFGGKSKKLAKSMLKHIKSAFEARLDRIKWMDQKTIAKAKKKLHAMGMKIGYPSVWKSYPGLVVGGNYFLNKMSSARVEVDRNFKKFGVPVDSTEWGMAPSTVNAYYAPSRNEMVFPAGILQPPFFKKEFPMVLNFGGVGSVMGHELSHGFDDQGARYDSTGKMKVWWTKASMLKFKNKTSCIAKQYSDIPLPELKGIEGAKGLHINGKLTLGENIADNGGVVTSRDAYKAWQTAKDSPTEFKVGGKTMSDMQLFWVAYAQLWCSIQNPKAMMVQLRSDPHSPGRARVVGPVQNNPSFSTAMNCPSEAPMNPEEKCSVW